MSFNLTEPSLYKTYLTSKLLSPIADFYFSLNFIISFHQLLFIFIPITEKNNSETNVVY